MELTASRTATAALLATETRIAATSDDARRAFGRYWLAVRLGSDLVRVSWLRAAGRRVTVGRHDAGAGARRWLSRQRRRRARRPHDAAAGGDARRGVDDVEHPEAEAPAGAKGGALEWAQLVVTLAGTRAGPMITALQGWLGRHPRAAVTLEIDGDKLTLDEASAAEQQRLVETFLARHGAG